MKKILSLLLVGIMVVSMVPTAFATTDYSNGTQVEYDAAEDDTIGDINGDGQPDNTEYYTVTVPALMAPGASGNVVAQGTWASNRKLTVTADTSVELTNSINSADKKDLAVTFPGIELAGSNTAAVSDTKAVSVAGIDNALFGTWSGTFYYDVEMVEAAKETATLTISCECLGATMTITYVPGMTWREWVESEYNFDQNNDCYVEIRYFEHDGTNALCQPNSGQDYLYDDNGEYVDADSLIDANITYEFAM